MNCCFVITLSVGDIKKFFVYFNLLCSQSAQFLPELATVLTGNKKGGCSSKSDLPVSATVLIGKKKKKKGSLVPKKLS